MNAHFAVRIQLVDSAGVTIELDRVSIDAVLYVQARVRYRFHVGVTDVHGRLVVTFEVVEKARLENQAFSIMDYNTQLEDCDPQLALTVPTLAELRERQAAKKRWFPNDVSAVGEVAGSNNGNVVCNPVYLNVDLNPKAEILLTCAKTQNPKPGSN